MLHQLLLGSILAASYPSVPEQDPQPVPGNNIQIFQNQQEEEDEGDLADRSSKNRQEYNLYDRQQNDRENDSGQYYYYQYQDGNRNQSRKLYQRDDG